jgi:hypothetical protein
LLARYLDVPLRYPMKLVGSRSMISDPISAEHRESPNFPLYSRGVDRNRFEYGVFLLNRNVEQLLHAQGLQSITLRHTLPNINKLMVACAHWCSGDMQKAPSNSN